MNALVTGAACFRYVFKRLFARGDEVVGVMASTTITTSTLRNRARLNPNLPFADIRLGILLMAHDKCSINGATVNAFSMIFKDDRPDPGKSKAPDNGAVEARWVLEWGNIFIGYTDRHRHRLDALPTPIMR